MGAKGQKAKQCSWQKDIKHSPRFRQLSGECVYTFSIYFDDFLQRIDQTS